MSRNSFIARLLRFLGILLMVLTGGFTLLGGIGTACVAFKPKGFGPSMAKIAPFQWLYILFVLAGITLGVLGIRAAIQLIKGHPGSYKNALGILIAGTLVGLLHIVSSRLLRGQSMPADAIVYVTVFTLVVFLIFKIPSIWQGVDFTKAPRKDNLKAGGAAAILLGVLALTIQFLMAPTHTWDGVNYANAFYVSMTVSGIALLLLGIGLLARVRLPEVSTRQLDASKTQI